MASSTQSVGTAPRSILDWRILLGFLALYVIWGTTFLAIRVAVHDLPPILAAGLRMFTAGMLVYGWCELRGAARPTALQWRNLAIVGSLLFFVDYGLLFWAERFIPSGIAAVLAATVPLMMIAFEMLAFRMLPFRWSLIGAVALGFVGVGVLLLPDTRQHLPLLPCLAVLLGNVGWCLGTILSKRMDVPAARAVTSGAAMMCGGAMLLVAAAIAGEMHPWPHLTRQAVVAMAYLIFIGSLLGFTTYMWMLSHLPASKVSSYAYVNPVVAVALGAVWAGEPITTHGLAGAALVLVSVFLILRGSTKK